MASKSKKNGRHDGSPGENDVLAQFLSVTGERERVAKPSGLVDLRFRVELPALFPAIT